MVTPYLPTRWLITSADTVDDPDVFPLMVDRYRHRDERARAAHQALVLSALELQGQLRGAARRGGHA
jgi:hypothetical protein